MEKELPFIVMIAIIIPLISKKLVRDWNSISVLLNRTLQSVIHQTSPHVKVVVVGHEQPPLPSEIEFIPCPLPLPVLPGVTNPTHYKQIDYILDKTRKIVLGMQYLQKWNPTYYFILDADDVLHKKTVELLLSLQHPNGYILNAGYEYFSDNQRLFYRSDIEKRCGSTTVLNSRLVNIPEHLDDQSVWNHPWGKVSHGDMESYFEGLQLPLYRLDTPLVLYTLGHGQNASDEFREGILAKIKVNIKKYICSKKMSTAIAMDFSL